jgi:hypothetical protein
MWSDGYLVQARSDWDAYNILQTAPIPNCHALHYLQMTTEKLGKAGLLASSGVSLDSVRTTHRAFTRFLQVASRNADFQSALVMTRSQLQMHIQQLLPIAHEIERLAPALAADGANSEYPWEAPGGTVNVPATYNFPVDAVLQSPRGQNLLKLVQVILNRFDSLFA